MASFCLTCLIEHESDTLVCPDCNQVLVDRMPAVTSSAATPDDSWVTMGGVQSRSGTDLARECLDSKNIPSVVMSRSFQSPKKSPNVDDRDDVNLIMVPREYREEAAIVLEAILGKNLLQADM